MERVMRSLVVLAAASLVATALPAAAQQPEPQQPQTQQPQPQPQEQQPEPQQPRPGMQPGMGMRMPMYDTATESTFTGTVQSVEEVTSPAGMGGGMRGMSGTHIVLKTDSGTMPVHLGPSSFLAEKNIRLEEGDEIEVVGSRTRMGSDEFVIARQVKRGDDEWTFRDQSGRPLWRMGRMQ